jgi:negative regulator of sigma E activity
MDQHSNIKATGMLKIDLFDKNGQLVETQTVKNLVVTSGLYHIASRMKTAGIPDQMSHMALGAGTTSPALSDTTLGSQLGITTMEVAGGTVSNNQITYSAVFSAGTATGAVTEAGIFNASSAGTMLCRTTFPVINKGADDSLAISWVVSIS